MKYFGLIFYQSLILFASHRFGFCEDLDYDLVVELVYLNDTGERSWEWLFLFKNPHSDEFFFSNQELNDICGGTFSADDVEIEELFVRVVRLSLLKRDTNKLFINLLFSHESSAQLLFQYIRSQQQGQTGKETTVEKLFQYQLDDSQNNEQRLKKLAEYAVFYTKWMNAEMSADKRAPNFTAYGPRTINFTKHGPSVIHQNVAYLILLSKTFNISERIGSNMYVLCAVDIITHSFILVFGCPNHASNFYKSVIRHVDRQIPCTIEWLLPDVLEKVHSL